MAIITLGAGQKYKFTSSGSNLQFKEGSDHPLGITIASGGLQAHGNLEIISGSAVFDGPISSSAPVRLSGLGGTYPSSGQVKTVFIQEDGTIQLGQVGSQTVDSGSGNIFTSDGNLVASRRVGLTAFNLSIKPGAFDAGTATLFIGGDATYDNKIGINTETPSEALDVVGSISASQDIYAGGDIFCEGIVTADEFHTTIISTSVNFSTGNTEFGDESSDLHKFTGSLEISGNIIVNDDDSLFKGMVSMSAMSSSLGIVTHGPISGTSTLDITGNTNLDGTLEVASDVTASANMVVGGSGSFTLLSASGDFDITGDIQSTGDIEFDGDAVIGSKNASDDLRVDAGAILNLGTVQSDNIYIGRNNNLNTFITLYAGDEIEALKIQSKTITANHPFTSSTDIKVAGSGSFTALSSSGTIHGKSNIIADNDISASGNIIAVKAHINTPLTFTANTSADEIVVGSGVGSKGISIYSGDTSTGGIYFASDLDEEGAGDNPAGNRHGVFAYSHNDSEFNLKTGGNQNAATIAHDGSTIHSNLDVSGTGSFTGGGIFGVNSRVGIGIATPDATLDVLAQNNKDIVAKFASSDDKARIVIADDNTSVSLFAKDSKFHIGTGSSDLNVFTVWPTEGRIGINTANPGQALEVIGEVSASSTGSFEFLTISQSISGSHVEATTFGEINTTAVSASVGLVTDGPVSASGTGSFGALNVTGSGKFGGPVTIFHPNTSPMANTRLSVGRSANESIKFNAQDTRHEIVSINDSDSNADHELGIGLGTPSSGDQKIKFYFADQNNSSQVSVMTLTDETRVGIGTVDPGATLHVMGIVSTSNDIVIESGDPTIHFKDTDGAFQGHVGVANALMELRTDQDDVDIEIRTNQFDKAIFIDDSTQRIGIGTETPDSTLTVHGDISASGVVFAARFESSGSDTKIDMVDDVVVTGNHTTSGSLSALRITSSLDGINVSGSVDIILQDGPTEFIRTKVGSFDEYHFRNDGNAFQIYNSTDDRKELVVDGDGGIGIGVSTPSVNGFALQVSGTIGVLGDGDHALGTKANRFSDVFAVQTTVGAIFETGLTTEGISELETGTVVVWNDSKLVPSYKEQDKMVMGVTQEGKDEPIILGAEPILVTGKVKEGDFLITSDKLGHAKAQSDEYLLRTGTVIAQALESAEGESNLIKGMIRKL